jgi:alkanesulfonate monooxygenase SsuD/methylene tetrahydromethanopterin reductase-like flavin-dependent oxidoreductase (luciferase family)
MDRLQLGISLPPATAGLADLRALVRAAEAGDVDLVEIQDHPYVHQFVDTLALIGSLLCDTERLRFFPDVACLPLRPPAVLAKTAATLDLRSGGRFELGLGAGAYWPAIEAMGGPRRSPGEAREALAEAIAVIRAMWETDGAARVQGRYYRLSGVRTGPAPAHPMEIWVGAVGPRMLRLTGRLADGWAGPIPSYLPFERLAEAQAIIDDAARAAGRDPRSVRRIAQVVGTIGESARSPWTGRGSAPIHDTVEGWSALIGRLARELRFDAVVFWPEAATMEQVMRFAGEVAPPARELARTPSR